MRFLADAGISPKTFDFLRPGTPIMRLVSASPSTRPHRDFGALDGYRASWLYGRKSV